MASAPPDDRAALPADDIVAHARFVRALAIELTHDAGAADELAARALAVAIEQRPETGPGLRVWLRRVVWRMFHRDRRDEERRHRREFAAARPESQPATVDLVAQMELQRRIAAAFDALAEPFKSTLFRRHFHDETPTRIAQATGVPLATVKSRLHRGLEQLRARLDAEHGGRREQWMGALVPWLALGGPTIVTTKSKVALAAAAAVLLTGSIAYVVHEAAARRSTGGTATPASATVAAAASEEKGTRSPVLEEATAPTRDAVTAPLPFASGIVVDEAGAPISGVAVVAALNDETGSGTMLIVASIELDDLAAATLARSDDSGRFSVPVVPPFLLGLHFLAPRFAPASFFELNADPAQNQELRIVLARGAQVRGRALDSEGRAVPGAKVLASRRLQEPRVRRASHRIDMPTFLEVSEVPALWATADLDGAFCFDSLPAGETSFSASAYGYDSWRSSITPSDTPLEIALCRTCFFLDVTDAKSSSPIPLPRAMVARADGGPWQRDETVPTLRWKNELDRPDVPPGRLYLHQGDLLRMFEGGKSSTRIARVLVSADGHRSATLELTPDPQREPPRITVALEPGDETPAFAGRVIASARARIELRFPDPAMSTDPSTSDPPTAIAEADAGGRFAITGLPPTRYRVDVTAPGFAPKWTFVELPKLDFEIALDSAAQLDVLTIDRSGAPVPDVPVHVQTKDRKLFWRQRSDATGLVTFDAIPAGEIEVAALPTLGYERKWITWSALPDDTFTLGETLTLAIGSHETVELTVPERSHVVLRVCDEQGGPAGTSTITFEGMSGPVGYMGNEFLSLLQDPERRTRKTDEQGELTLDLFPSHYALRVQRGLLEHRTEVDVPDEREATIEIRLPIYRPTAHVSGRVVELGTGAPLADCQIYWFSHGETEASRAQGSTRTDGDGRFDLPQVLLGSITLAAYAPGSVDERGFATDQEQFGGASRHLALSAGDALVADFELAPLAKSDHLRDATELDLTLVDAASGQAIPSTTIFLQSTRGDAELFVGSARTDADGRARLRVASLPSYQILVIGAPDPKTGSMDTGGRATIEVAAGTRLLRETIRVQRP